jgi:predicted metal-dependent phosphoesterase TrpH
MGTADLHLHSAWSDGMAAVPEVMRYVEERTTLDVVAIADHDQVGGALVAVEWCAGRPACRTRAVVGTEISAAWGRHVLALFFTEPYPTRPLPRFRPLGETLRRIADAGGVAVVPHPCSALVPSIGRRTLEAALRQPAARATLLGIEVCSGVVGGRRASAAIRAANAAGWYLPEVGSSDAHHLQQIGTAYTVFPGHTPGDLYAALRARETRAAWGAPARVPVLAHARQNWLSLVVKPVREIRAALRSPQRPTRRRPELPAS